MKRKNLISTLFSVLTILTLCGVITAQDSLVFVIRVDDIMNRNTTILPRSIQPFEDMANARGAKITWAVIPHRLIESQNQDGKLVQELIASVENGHEISQHGYNHHCQVCNSWNHEMRCSAYNSPLTYAEQESLITNGMQILIDYLGVQATTFVPPGHNADNTTFNVLVDYGFHWISTSAPTKSYLYPDLYNLAPYKEFTWAMKPADYQQKLQTALNEIQTQGAKDGYYCLLLHDYFIRQGYENGVVIQWTGELLDSLLAMYGSDIKFMTVGQAAQHFASPIASIDQMTTELPFAFTLNQNYPNPFNSSTQIGFQLPRRDFVSLKVFNILGNEVARLLNEEKLEGTHRIEFHPTNLTSGIYFYRMQVGALTETRKFTYMR